MMLSFLELGMISTLPEGPCFTTPLSTIVFSWLLAIWGVVTRGGLVLERSELLLFTGGSTAPGVCSSPEENEPYPSSLWMQYFIEICLEGGLGLSGQINYVLPGSSLS